MMMKYRQNSSTFVPRKKITPDPNTPADDIPDPSNEKLILQIEEYSNRMRELQEQLKFRDNEILSANELIASLQEEITGLKDMQISGIPGDTAEKDSLDIKLSDIEEENVKLKKEFDIQEEENVKLKKEIGIQNEHIQLLYVLITILSII